MQFNVRELIDSRDSSHGPYDDTAKTIQNTKSLWRSQGGWHDLSNPQKEALDMVASKVGRILAGNQSEPDHWKDICGYCQLIIDRIHDDHAKAVIASATPYDPTDTPRRVPRMD